MLIKSMEYNWEGVKTKEKKSAEYLSVQACSHCNNASSFIVDGEHVGGWTLWILRQDLVTEHAICCFGVVFVNRSYRHNKGSFGRQKTSQNTNTSMLTSLFFQLVTKKKNIWNRWNAAKPSTVESNAMELRVLYPNCFTTTTLTTRPSQEKTTALLYFPASFYIIQYTWLGTLWNSAIPDLMSELRSVVIHVDHVDHNINWVFNLVAVQVYCMSSQLEENTNICGL